MYAVFAGAVLLLGVVALLLHYLAPQKLHRIIRHSVSRKHALTLLIPLIGLSIAGVGFGIWLHGHKPEVRPTSVVPDEKAKPLPAVAATPTLPAYEILKKAELAQGSKRIMVYTLESDKQKLELLNTQLLKEYASNGKQAVTIDYFDSKAVAQIYFQKIADNTVSTDDKRKLFSHYIATSSTNSPFNSQIVFLKDRADVASKLLAKQPSQGVKKQ